MVAEGELTYEVVRGWEQLPEGMTHKDVSGVAVDSRDRVYLLTRMDPRVIVYDRDGTFVTTWGEDLFTNRTHGLRVGPDDSIYCVDDGLHTVSKFSPGGELMMTIGAPGVASDTGYDLRLASADLWTRLASIKRGGPPFNRPTNLAVAPNGDLYVTDGYGNARVHRFTADGELTQSWGEPGTGPGQFNLPHDLCITPDGRVLVVDRENDRIQIFTLEGRFLDQWTHLQRPTGIGMDREGRFFVSELNRRKGQQTCAKGVVPENLPGMVSILDNNGKRLARWGTLDAYAWGQFCAPHAIAVDSHGDIYVGEVTWTDAVRFGHLPEDTHTFQKFTRR